MQRTSNIIRKIKYIKFSNYFVFNKNNKFKTSKEINKLFVNKDLEIKTPTGYKVTFKNRGLKEQIEVVTNTGYLIKLKNQDNEIENISIEKNGKNKNSNNNYYNSKNSCHIILDTCQDKISITGQSNLTIRAENLEIEATKEMKIKAGSDMIINGSTVHIN